MTNKEKKVVVHEEIDFLLEDNKELREQIRELALKSDLPHTCSNISCSLQDLTSIFDNNPSTLQKSKSNIRTRLLLSNCRL